MTPRMIRAYDALRAAGWHDAEAARELGVCRSTIAKMLRERREKESPVELPQPGEMALQASESPNPRNHTAAACQAPPAPCAPPSCPVLGLPASRFVPPPSISASAPGRRQTSPGI